MEAEIRVMLLTAKESLGLSEALRGREESSSRDSGEHITQLTPSFWTSSLQNC